MIVSVAKLLAACCAVTAPFIAGMLIPGLNQIGAAAVIGLVGLGLGGFGLVVFCALDSAEELDHLRRLNPNLRS
jgi:hypothetical protein